MVDSVQKIITGLPLKIIASMSLGLLSRLRPDSGEAPSLPDRFSRPPPALADGFCELSWHDWCPSSKLEVPNTPQVLGSTYPFKDCTGPFSLVEQGHVLPKYCTQIWLRVPEDLHDPSVMSFMRQEMSNHSGFFT